MADKTTLRARFDKADTARTSILDSARDCSALTLPHILSRPFGTAKDYTHQPSIAQGMAYTSRGSVGVTGMAGKMLLALFPPNSPWFELNVPGRFNYDPQADPELLQAAANRLFLWELILVSSLESSNLADAGNGWQVTFRSRKRACTEQILVCGDALEELDDDLRIKLFRCDQYVTRRDSTGNVLFHGIREQVDPLSLPEDQQAKAELQDSQRDKDCPEERLDDRYTFVDWHPWSRTWVVRREFNNHIIEEKEEAITPFFSTPFDLAGGEDYGRSFVWRNFGDLNTLNELQAARLRILALAGKGVPCINHGSQTDEEDLAGPSGVPIRADVRAGQVQDVALLSFADVRDFQMLTAGVQEFNAAIDRAFLVETSVQPRGERVTATQVQRVAAELDGALGGAYAPIAEGQQLPLIRRAIHVLRRKAALPPMPSGMVEITALTGLAALAREQKANRIVSYGSIIAQLGPEALARINKGVLLDVLQRYFGIYEPGLIMTEQQVAAEQRNAIRQQTALAAGEQAIETAGRIVENAVTTQGT